MAQSQYRLNFQKIGWRGQVGVVLAVALGVAVAVALVILAAGLLVIVLPVAVVAVLVGRWRLRKMMETAKAARRAEEPRTIEIDYRVIDGEQRPPR